MRSFFIDTKLSVNQTFALPKEESRHACKVLRLTPGTIIKLVNGLGDAYEAEIHIADSKACQVKVLHHKEEVKDKHHIHIAIAPTKSNDRFEFFLEKATELGVHEITPLRCKNSERTMIKPERFEKVLKAAMKQSQRLYLPKLNELTLFSDFVKQHEGGCIAHCEDTQRSSFNEVAIALDCPILIGPEGDFTTEEITEAFRNNFKAVTLGKTRLRTETAGLYACMLMKNKFE